MNNLKKFDGLSIRAMTMLGVLLLEKLCNKNQIVNSDLKEFINKMLELLTVENIPEWDNECNQIKITGLGDELPEKLVVEYPEYGKNIDEITQNIREISASQIYAEWNPKISYSHLNRIQELCQVGIDTEFDLELFKKHDAGATGWGIEVSNELIEEWKKSW
ncbi:hypothetical protein [Aquimarina sp. AU119]|uniref:hypothetical protein n=1 Tax=Aquimarina sp. AU119 TaxID=2108528 RepID=UPI000D691373|nr:hypothetical protein [Aquimarina sp. AU119]